MRSAIVLAVLVLAGCERAPPQEEVTTVDLKQAPQTGPTVPPPPTATPLQRYKAIGTEPFWAVFVEPGRMRYTTPENITGTHFPATYSVEGKAEVWTGTFEGGPFTLRIAPGTCSDGMSDTVYAYTASVAFKGQTLQGCAQLN